MTHSFSCTWLASVIVAIAAMQESSAADPPLVRLTSDGLYKQRPAWSPDGKRLVFARHEGDAIRLYLIDQQGGETTRLTERQHPEYDAVWSPDGKRLAFAAVMVSGSQGDVDVYTIGADGKDLRPFAMTEGVLTHEESPAWSQDGKRICYSSTREANQDLYVADADGANVVRLTSDAGLDAHPAWSPDGKRIVFATDRWGDWELAAVNVDDQSVSRLTTSAGLDDYPAWSPDGKRIAFTSNRDGDYEIYIVDANGGEPIRLTHDEGLDHFAAWRPDGKALAFVSNRDGGFELYVQSIAP